jgi:hypothetical protein
MNSDKFISTGNVDYSKLCNLLTAQRWIEANQETLAIMLHLSGRQLEGWLRGEDIEKIPCQDLCIIDQLWLEYSNGHFGFSTQKQILASLGGSKKFDYQTYCRFGDRIGWRVKGDWITYSDLMNTLNAPDGHLPSVYPGARWGWLGRLLCRWQVSSLTSRVPS